MKGEYSPVATIMQRRLGRFQRGCWWREWWSVLLVEGDEVCCGVEKK